MMQSRILSGDHTWDSGLYQVDLKVVLDEPDEVTGGQLRIAQKIPRWLAEEISKALGGNGDADLVDRTGEWDLWSIHLPAPFNGEVEFTLKVRVETPMP